MPFIETVGLILQKSMGSLPFMGVGLGPIFQNALQTAVSSIITETYNKIIAEQERIWEVKARKVRFSSATL